MDSATGSPGLLWFRSILPHFSFLILSILILAGSAQAAPCPLNSANPSVTICTPTNGATVTSPVNIVAGTTDSATVIAMAIYVDNNLAYKDNVSVINTNVTMSPGSHYVVVQSWDSAGNIPKTPINITVAAGGGGGPCAANPNNNTLTICTPAANTTVTSPVSVVAEATSSSPVDKFLVYVDSVLQYQQLNTSSINTSVSVSPGTHNLTVQYYNVD
jgi:Big-like domain-containing protein